MKIKQTLFFLIFVFIVGSFTLIYLKANKENNSNLTVPEVTLPNVSEVSAAPDKTLESPDGKYLLTMQEKIDKNSVTYTLTSSSGLIFTKTVSKADNLSLPFNSWSPDNKYVFLKEISNGLGNFYVLSSSNKFFPNDVKYLNIRENFTKKVPNYKLDDVTGWASPTLIVVNTDKTNGEQGPSFWFDITTQNFIQLSTRFN